jgi:hypothetical protein
MKLKKTPFLFLVVIALAAPAAQAAVITDFSSFTADANLLPSPNLIDQTFITSATSSTNTIRIDYLGGASVTSVAGQAVFLSDSYSLTVGDTLIVDYGAATTPTGGASGASSFGLAIATNEVNSDRRNLLVWNYRKQVSTGTGLSGSSVLRYENFDSGAAFTNAATGTFTTLTAGSIPDSLFIKKTATGYDLGYIEGGTSFTSFSLTSGAVITTTAAAVGVYADSRGTTSDYTLNNLRIVPEPEAALLGSLGMLTLLRRRRL